MDSVRKGLVIRALSAASVISALAAIGGAGTKWMS